MTEPRTNMTVLFMTSEQLKDMTGLVQSAAQIKWLRANNVEHFIRADGKVRVPLPISRRTGAPSVAKGPNLEAVRARH